MPAVETQLDGKLARMRKIIRKLRNGLMVRRHSIVFAAEPLCCNTRKTHRNAAEHGHTSIDVVIAVAGPMCACVWVEHVLLACIPVNLTYSRASQRPLTLNLFQQKKNRKTTRKNRIIRTKIRQHTAQTETMAECLIELHAMAQFDYCTWHTHAQALPSALEWAADTHGARTPTTLTSSSTTTNKRRTG